MGIRLAKSLEAFELKTILLRWRRFRAASFFGMARDELFRRARAMANSSWRAFWRGFGYCLRQYAFARALSSVGNTRTFARYRLRRYARIVWLRGLRLLPAAIRLRACAIACRQYAHVCALSSASIRAHCGAAWAMEALPGEKVPRRFWEGDLGEKFGRAIGG